jgi:predicted alpha/beta hydrolase family esterase
LVESWCATLHQAVPCAQRQDVVVAHQPGGGDYLRINSLRRG